MIVAGIGSRKGVSAADVLAAIDAALAAHGLSRDALAALATTTFKQDEAGIVEAAGVLGLDVVVSAPPHPASAEPVLGLAEGKTRGLGHPLPVGERRPADACATSSGSLEQQSTGSSPQRGEGGRAKRRPGEGEWSDELEHLTHSPLSLRHAGTQSVSETAALLAAGPGARLLGPRIATGRVTCALAQSGEPA